MSEVWERKREVLELADGWCALDIYILDFHVKCVNQHASVPMG